MPPIKRPVCRQCGLSYDKGKLAAHKKALPTHHRTKAQMKKDYGFKPKHSIRAGMSAAERDAVDRKNAADRKRYEARKR